MSYKVTDADLARLDEARKSFKVKVNSYKIDVIPEEPILLSEGDFESIAEPTYNFTNITYRDLLNTTKDPEIYNIVSKNIAILERAHDYSDHHREALESSKVYGCFYCVSIFLKSNLVKEWIDDGQTALCPRCGIDAILPYNDKEYRLTQHFLSAMKDYWFERSSKI